MADVDCVSQLEVVANTQVGVDNLPYKSEKSLPFGLDLGVIARFTINVGVCLGPYEGKIVYNISESDHQQYLWPVFRRGRIVYHIDGFDYRHSNWLRYIRRTTDSEISNLHVVQHGGEIFFQAIRDISTGEELVVDETVCNLLETGQDEPSPLPDGDFKCKICSETLEDQCKLQKHVFKHNHSEKKCPSCDFEGEKDDDVYYHVATAHAVKWSELIRNEVVQEPEPVTTQLIPLSSFEVSVNDSELSFVANELEKSIIGKPRITISTLNESYIINESAEKQKRNRSKPINCHVCGETLPSSMAYRSHLYVHYEGEKCKHCKLRFKDLDELEAHMQTHKFNCHICRAACEDKKRLIEHINLHPEENYCPICGMNFDTTYRMHRHLGTHSIETVFKCTLCNEIFNTRSVVLNHCKVHSDVESVEVERLVRDRVLSRFMVKSEAGPNKSRDKSVSCPTCGKICRNKALLWGHLRTHGDRNFKCPSCKKGFFNSNKLKRHTDAFPNGMCAFRHSRIGSVADLKKVKYHCGICNKFFENKWKLNVHKAVHYKKIKCEACGHTFINSFKLMRHHAAYPNGICVDMKKTFDTEKVYACLLCKDKFETQEDLHSHELTHVSPGGKCEKCDALFETEEELTAHTETAACENEDMDVSEDVEDDTKDDEEMEIKLADEKPCKACGNDECSCPKKQNLICEYCNTSQPNPSKLKRHVQTHFKKCVYCDFETVSIEAYQKHSCENMRTCNVCKAVFDTIPSLHQHQEATQHVGILQCEICYKTFGKKGDLIMHRKSHRNDTFKICPLCSEPFAIPHRLKVHLLKVHHKHLFYNCKVCSQQFVSKIEIDRHVARHDDPPTDSVEVLIVNRVETCDNCQLVFSDVQRLTEHIEEHASEEIVSTECPVCRDPCPSVSAMNHHLQDEHNKKARYKCMICQDELKNKKEADDHTKTHDVDEVVFGYIIEDYVEDKEEFEASTMSDDESADIKSVKTSASYISDSGVRKSRRLSKRGNNVCRHCGEIFSSVVTLIEHMAGHKDDEMSIRSKDDIDDKDYGLSAQKKHKCKYCGMLFPKKYRLLRHEETHSKLQCKHCVRKFLSPEECAEHMATHQFKSTQNTSNQESPHMLASRCDICNITFVSNSDFAAHLRTHLDSDEKEMKFKIGRGKIIKECSICGFECDSTTALKKHTKTHNKTLRCASCMSRFETEEELHEHEAIHEKTFQCNLCIKSFSTEPIFNRHMNAHKKANNKNKQKSFPCDLCQKVFERRYLLNKHLKRHKKTIQCAICNKLFEKEDDLKFHEESHFKYHCIPCNISFSNRIVWTKHQQEHENT